MVCSRLFRRSACRARPVPDLPGFPQQSHRIRFAEHGPPPIGDNREEVRCAGRGWTAIAHRPISGRSGKSRALPDGFKGLGSACRARPVPDLPGYLAEPAMPGPPHPRRRHPDPRGGRLGTGPQRRPPAGELALHHPRCPHQAQTPLPVNSKRVKH